MSFLTHEKSEGKTAVVLVQQFRENQGIQVQIGGNPVLSNRFFIELLWTTGSKEVECTECFKINNEDIDVLPLPIIIVNF